MNEVNRYGKFLMDTFNSAPMDFSLILCATGVASGAVQFFIFPYLHDKKHVSISMERMQEL